LSAAGVLAPESAEDSHFCAKTHAAVIAFQDAHGLAVTGDVDEHMWSALIESSWSLGTRLLYFRSPNIRGDDVADLQTQLNRMGFDCGRVDGIYGTKAVLAITDFQINLGLEGNGICSPELLLLVQSMGTHSGTGPGVAVIRESVGLARLDSRNEARIVVGLFNGAEPLAHAIAHRLQVSHPLTITVNSDTSAQAQAANQFIADIYIGVEPSTDAGCTIQFYEVPTFVSVGGRNLAARITAAVSARIPELTIRIQGSRHPLLRETQMTAVLCCVGPDEIVSLKINALSTALCDAVDAWRADPLTEL